LGISAIIYSQQHTLDNAAYLSSVDIAQRVAPNSSFAVVNINSLSDDLSIHIITLLETGLVNTDKLSIVSRQRINTVLNEQNFGLSGYVDDNSAQRIGYLLGAKFVMTGELTKPENKYFLNLQVLETETARLIYSRTFEINNNELRRYEQLILAKERLEKLERERLIKEEERKQKQELDRIAAQERKIKWDNFLRSISLDINMENWSPASTMFFEIGYNYTPDLPLGFVIGFFGLYSTINFGIPDWQGYSQGYNTYNSDGRIGGYNSSYTEYTDRGKRVHENIQWSVGYAFNIINKILMLPIGIGAKHTKEWRLYDKWWNSSYSGRELDSTEWYGSTDWNTDIIIEAGLQLNIKYVTLYSMYRLIGFQESSYTLGCGFILQ
jgi:TolB-like protein